MNLLLNIEFGSIALPHLQLKHFSVVKMTGNNRQSKALLLYFKWNDLLIFKEIDK